MKERYDVVESFWHKGQFVPAGAALMLTEAEAKYLGGQVKKKAAVATAAPASTAQ